MAASIIYILGDFDFKGIYYDDTMIISATIKDHLVYLDSIFGRFAECNKRIILNKGLYYSASVCSLTAKEDTPQLINYFIHVSRP